MKTALARLALATCTGALMTAGALAQTATATATSDLNIRSGPGPQFDIVGLIPAESSATVEGCLDESLWCQVDYDGATGWAYSDYLTIDAQGTAVILTERPPELIGPVTYEGPNDATVGAAGGAIAGALIAGPAGAIIGGALGLGAGAVIEATDPAVIYARDNPVEQVYLEGEVVVGAGIPETVTLLEIPKSPYRYVYVNGVPVLVEPDTREIVYIIR